MGQDPAGTKEQVSMAYDKVKPDHNGAKNGGGGWGARERIKKASKKRRRVADKAAEKQC